MVWKKCGTEREKKRNRKRRKRKRSGQFDHGLFIRVVVCSCSSDKMDNDERKEKQGSSLVCVWVNKCDLLQEIILSAAGCGAGRMMNDESSQLEKKGRNATERTPRGETGRSGTEKHACIASKD